ncbi:MAG: DsbA family oxidoreductase [Sphingobium sp.]
MPVTITVTSDFVCPWCFIGNAKLAAALAALPADIGVDLRYLPFELNPGMPVEGVDRQSFRARKFGSLAKAEELDARVVAVGREMGLAFHYDRVRLTPNTTVLHQLMWMAGQGAGSQSALAARLFAAYFTEGRDLTDREEVRRIALMADLPAHAVDAVLNEGAGAAEVEALMQQARARGISSIPHIAIDGMAFAGAQPVEIIARLISDAAARQKDAAAAP